MTYAFTSPPTLTINRHRSEPLIIQIEPLEPAYLRVAHTMEVKSGFNSFFLDWTNELKQNINVYVDFEFVDNGQPRALTSVFSSNLESDRRFINDLALGADHKGKSRTKFISPGMAPKRTVI